LRSIGDGSFPALFAGVNICPHRAIPADSAPRQPAHTLAIALVKQRFNRFAVQVNQSGIRLVFAHARQTALFNDILCVHAHKLLTSSTPPELSTCWLHTAECATLFGTTRVINALHMIGNHAR
jgi:hypothetical protein